MKGGVLSVWFKIKNIKSFNRHPPGCYQKIRENILKCQSYSGNCTCASDFSVSDAWCTLFCSVYGNSRSYGTENPWSGKTDGSLCLWFTADNRSGLSSWIFHFFRKIRWNWSGGGVSNQQSDAGIFFWKTTDYPERICKGMDRKGFSQRTAERRKWRKQREGFCDRTWYRLP